MQNKRPAVIKLREQEVADIKSWCTILKRAYRAGLSQGRYLGTLTLSLFFTGFVISLAINIFIVPQGWKWITSVAMLFLGAFVAWLERYLAKRYTKQHEQQVESLEQDMIANFDKLMVIKKGDK